MEINKVKESGSYFVINDSFWIPKVVENSDYKTIQRWIENGGVVESEFSLSELKNKKLQELDIYHYNDKAIRQCKVNSFFVLQLNSEVRTLIQEQINLLSQKIELGLIEEQDAEFEFFYTGGSIKIKLEQLRKIYVAMLDIVNFNFQNYKKEISTINSLSTIEEVDNHDFTVSYLKNQNINI